MAGYGGFHNPMMACHDGSHPAAKLTDATVRRIRRRVLDEGLSRREVAESLGLHPDTVAKIVRRQSYWSSHMMDGATIAMPEPAAMEAAKADALPAHSPLGASSAERWMNCPGSVTLIDLVRAADRYEEADPDYRRDGTQAHALAAHCLEDGLDAWEADETQFPELTADMMGAVQEYLDFVRVQDGFREVEQRVHIPEFHPQFYGTLDCVVSGGGMLHVVDYKHGVGVVVDADDNPQLKYYAYGYLGRKEEAAEGWQDSHVVRLTIVQPRAFHPDGTIRSWDTTVGEIRRWAEEELKPAMEATRDLDYLALGQWCRFCPAKLVCPAYDGLARKSLQAPTRLTYAEAQQLKMLIKAVEEDAERRALAGEDVSAEGVKVVKKISHRQWKTSVLMHKPGEPALLEAKFGADAWKPRAYKGPPDIEKLPGGKDFVAEFAFQPDNGLTIAPMTDRRRAVKVLTAEEKYGDPAQYT